MNQFEYVCICIQEWLRAKIVSSRGTKNAQLPFPSLVFLAQSLFAFKHSLITYIIIYKYVIAAQIDEQAILSSTSSHDAETNTCDVMDRHATIRPSTSRPNETEPQTPMSLAKIKHWLSQTPKDPEFFVKRLNETSKWLKTVRDRMINYTVKRCELNAIAPKRWLSDQVIDSYMLLINKRSQKDPTLPKILAMRVFYLRLLMNFGSENIGTENFFNFDYVLLPHHQANRNHWSLIVIDIKQQSIAYYDSLHSPTQGDEVMQKLLEHLENIALNKKVRWNKAEWTTNHVSNCPQQTNGYDCGVFACVFANYLALNAKSPFTQEHMEYYRLRMIYELCEDKLLEADAGAALKLAWERPKIDRFEHKTKPKPKGKFSFVSVFEDRYFILFGICKYE